MLTNSQIAERIDHPEGPLIERKLQTVNDREIRQTVVAFANSVSNSDHAILFIGVRDDGAVEGCTHTDKMQKRIREVCEIQCYPPVKYYIAIVSSAQNVVAVVIPPSSNRPHFAGPAFVRRGSESVSASAEQFEELILAREPKIARLLQFKRDHTIFRIIGLGHKLGKTVRTGARNYSEVIEQCKVAKCDQDFVTFRAVSGDGREFSVSLQNLSIKFDNERHCPEIVVTGY